MANVDISYKDQSIGSVNNEEEKVLKTAGKYCEDNITLQLVGEEIPPGSCFNLETVNGEGEVVTAKLYGVKPVAPSKYYSEDSLETVSLEEGITSIGDLAFAYCSKLANITMSNTITSIGNYAFYHSNLTNILIPDSVISIGDYAFGIRSLENIVLGDNLQYIGGDVFDINSPYYTNLTADETNWQNDILYVKNYVFGNRNSVTDVVLKDGTKVIAGGAFYGSSLSSIIVPEGVLGIGSGAFQQASLSEITLPSSISRIGNTAFSNCSNLTKVSIKGNRVDLGESIFSNCSALTTVEMPGATTIPGYAFSGCSNLTTLTLGKNLTDIIVGTYSSGFYNCEKLKDVYYNGTPGEWANINFSELTASPGYGSKGYNLYCNGELLINLTLSSDVKPYAFSYCTSLKKVTIENDISIGDRAFIWAEIPEIEFGENVTSVGSINYMSNLTTVTLGSNIRTIAKGAFFSYSTNQKNLYYKGTLESWCNIEYIEGTGEGPESSLGLMYMYSLYIDNQKVVDLVIPETITTIKQNSFSMNNGIKTVTIGDNVTYIEPYSFAYCVSLENISIGKNITQVDEFINSIRLCPSLKSISVGADNPVFLTEENVLFNKEKTTLFIYPSSRIGETYTIPSGVTTLSGSSFSQLANLKHLIIPDEVISADDAIDGSSLLTITIGSGMENLGSDPFKSCRALTTITVNEQNQTYSSENGVLFNKDKTQILRYPRSKTETSFTIPATVTSLVDYTFYRADNLIVLTFEGTPESIESYALSSSLTTINVPWAEGAVANAPWGATNATINYNYTGGEN